MSLDPSIPADSAQESRSGRLVAWSLLLLGLAWFIFEFTANPWAGPALAGAKFGCDDLLTAFWLRRGDPDLRRGRIAFWLYLTWGMIKLIVVAFTIMMLVGLLHELVSWLRGVPAGPGLGQLA